MIYLLIAIAIILVIYALGAILIKTIVKEENKQKKWIKAWNVFGWILALFS